MKVVSCVWPSTPLVAQGRTRLLFPCSLRSRGAIRVAARGATPAPTATEYEEPKTKRKYTKRKSIAPVDPLVEGASGEPAVAAPVPAEPPKRKTRARSKPAPILNLPDSHLPWAGQGGQVEAEGIVSSRGAARAASGEPDQEADGQQQAKKPSSRRKLQRGLAALEGDQLSKTMLEKTMRTDEEGNRFVDRATLGQGQVQWYGIGVVVGKEKKFKEALEQRIASAPMSTDESTGEFLPKPEVEVLIPTRKVASKSESGRKTTKTIKYMDGGLVFVRCALNNDLIDFIQDLPYYRSWRDEVTWSYSGLGNVVLPKPATKEAMDSLDNWMYGEVAPEDLPQIDEDAARMDPGAPTELNERGNEIIQRDFTGSYTNPNAWFDGSADTPAPPKRRGSTPKATTRIEAAPAPPASTFRPNSSQQQQQQQQQHHHHHQNGLFPADARSGSGLDEEKSIQLAERYFGSQKTSEAGGDGSSSSTRGGWKDVRGKRSARDAPPYPERGWDGGSMLHMDDELLFADSYNGDDSFGLGGDFDDGFGHGEETWAPSFPPPRGNDGRWAQASRDSSGKQGQVPRQQGRGQQDNWMYDGKQGGMDKWGAGGQHAAPAASSWADQGRQAGPFSSPRSPGFGTDRNWQWPQGGSSGYVDELDVFEEQGGYLEPTRGNDDVDAIYGGLDFDFVGFDDDVEALDMSDEEMMGPSGGAEGYMGGTPPMWGDSGSNFGAYQQGRGRGFRREGGRGGRGGGGRLSNDDGEGGRGGRGGSHNNSSNGGGRGDGRFGGGRGGGGGRGQAHGRGRGY